MNAASPGGPPRTSPTQLPTDPAERAAASPDAPGSGPGDVAPPSTRRPAFAWGLLLLVVGSGWLLATLDVPVPWDLVLPATVIAIGVLLLTVGRRLAVGGLVALGIVLAALAVIMSVLPATSFTAGDRLHHVTDVAELGAIYELGAGKMVLDLRDLALPSGTTTARARVSMGELLVRVPGDAALEGLATASMGEVVVLGRQRAGIRPRLDLSTDGAAGAQVLELELQVGLGKVEVTR